MQTPPQYKIFFLRLVFLFFLPLTILTLCPLYKQLYETRWKKVTEKRQSDWREDGRGCEQSHQFSTILSQGVEVWGLLSEKGAPDSNYCIV